MKAQVLTTDHWGIPCHFWEHKGSSALGIGLECFAELVMLWQSCLSPTSECVFYTCALTGALNSFRWSPSSWGLGLGAPEAGESSVLCPPQTSRVLSRRQPICLSPQEELRASQVVQLQRIWKHKRPGFDPRVRKIPWKKKRQPTPVFLPGKFHGQRSLVGYSPWDYEESDATDHAHAHDQNWEVQTVRNAIQPHKNILLCYLVAKLCLTLQPHGLYSPPGSSVHGILLARILEWVAIPFSRGSNLSLLCLPRWQVDSLPLRLLGSPPSEYGRIELQIIPRPWDTRVTIGETEGNVDSSLGAQRTVQQD